MLFAKVLLAVTIGDSVLTEASAWPAGGRRPGVRVFLRTAQHVRHAYVGRVRLNWVGPGARPASALDVRLTPNDA